MRPKLALTLVCLVLSACGLVRCGAAPPIDRAALDALHATPLPPPEGPLAVYHLGHSLVGRDMPAMLQQLAPPGHRHASQLGWGTSLKDHWGGPDAVKGFAEENAHPAHRPAAEALDGGGWDALVLTEMVELKDAIRWHDSGLHLARWTARARKAAPGLRVYLYETWHQLDDPGGWLERIDADLGALWFGQVLQPALAQDGVGGPVHLIPAGQAMARFVRAVEAAPGGIGGIDARDDLFLKNPDGTQDMIHLNDLGAYLVALVHYAVLYHRSPEGLPHALRRADGSAAEAPSAEAALAMQRAVWDTVAAIPATGVARPSR
jgi:hypothetical protein